MTETLSLDKAIAAASPPFKALMKLRLRSKIRRLEGAGLSAPRAARACRPQFLRKNRLFGHALGLFGLLSAATSTVTVPAHAAVIRIDVSTAAGPGGAGWNTINSINTTDQALLDTDGGSSGITWTDRGFGGSSSNGVYDFTGNALSVFGSNSYAMRDYFYGSVSSPNPVITFRGLDVSHTYTFTIFAGRLPVSNTRTGSYTLAGNGAGGTSTLNASNNTGHVITFPNVKPTGDGVVTLSLAAAGTNNDGDKYFYVNAVQIESAPAAVILIDASAAGGPGGAGWNTINSINTTDQALVDTDGASSGITWTDRGFDGSSSNGVYDFTGNALSVFGSNSYAMRDYFYGSVSSQNPVITFRGLDVSHTYTFTIFAGRLPVSNTRTGSYTLAGNGAGGTSILNASNNTGNVIAFPNVKPTGDGVVTLSLAAAGTNNDGNKYFYVNAVKIESAPGPSATDIESRYTWKPLQIGGGGWVVGLDVHPNGVAYARTDVSGAYLWDAGDNSWRQLVTASSMPPEYVRFGKYGGVDSIVACPSNLDRAYMAFAGQIFKSTNRGSTWTPTNFAANAVVMSPNGESRRCGERLGVDPRNENVVIYCPIDDHPWITTNSGTTWSRITAIPRGLSGWGITTVKFDTNSGTTNGRTNVIYITVEEGGVYRSSNAGSTWANIASAGGGPGKARGPRDAAVAPDRSYYVCYGTDEKHRSGQLLGGVWKYSPSTGVWTNITPDKTNNRSYEAVAVDPFNSNRITVMIPGGATWTSLNGGASWNAQGWTRVSSDIPWLAAQTDGWLSVGQLAYDPVESGRLWFGEGFGVWTTTDLADGQISWVSRSRGIEEMCGNDVICPPGGNPITASWDISAFTHENPDSYAGTRRMLNSFMSAWSLDWSGNNPSTIVGVFDDHTFSHAPKHASGYSLDGGLTWTRFPSLENGTHPGDLRFGLIAASAGGLGHYVWCPENNKLPYYTLNHGATWTQGSFGGPTTSQFYQRFIPRKALCADRVAADTYYFSRVEDGIYRSTNGGISWVRVGNNPSNWRWNSTLKAVPGHQGHLWFSAGRQEGDDNGSPPPWCGLWRSVDGGETWTFIPDNVLTRAYNVGFGKAKPGGSGYPTIYVAGEAGGVEGIFRSTDAGATWNKIGGYPLGIFDSVDAIDGDKDIFGKVYIGFSGAGFVYGSTTEP